MTQSGLLFLARNDARLKAKAERLLAIDAEIKLLTKVIPASLLEVETLESGRGTRRAASGGVDIAVREAQKSERKLAKQARISRTYDESEGVTPKAKRQHREREDQEAQAEVEKQPEESAQEFLL